MLFQILDTNLKEKRVKLERKLSDDDATIVRLYFEEKKKAKEILEILGPERFDHKQIENRIRCLIKDCKREHDDENCSCYKSSGTPCLYKQRNGKYHSCKNRNIFQI